VADDPSIDHLNRKLRCLLHCAFHRRTIRLTCPACQRVRRFDAVALWWFFERRHQDDDIAVVRRRFCCRVCRKAGVVVRPRFEITTEPPDPDQPDYPTESEWKRQVSRYRS
jgi:hypothetical protein